MKGYGLAVAIALVLVLEFTPLVEGGCREANLCCDSKNNTCRTTGPRMNNNESHTCFCDSGCSILGDCCTDFDQACPAVDCLLDDEWGPWGDCSEMCGWGKKERQRRIMKKNKYGGEACGENRQTLYCYGDKCKNKRNPEGAAEARETGKIIPAKFGSHRNSKKYNPYKDIRRNLFNHYSANSIIKRPAYYAKFEISHANSACLNSPLHYAQKLHKGKTICIECQPLAMKKKLGVRCHGHGVYLRETRWNAVTVPGCHGKWVMKKNREDGECNTDEELSFILI